MAELKSFELIMRISPVAGLNGKSEVCFSAEKVSELIRCKDCKHFNDGDCTELPKLVSEYDFCSFGESK